MGEKKGQAASVRMNGTEQQDGQDGKMGKGWMDVWEKVKGIKSINQIKSNGEGGKKRWMGGACVPGSHQTSVNRSSQVPDEFM